MLAKPTKPMKVTEDDIVFRSIIRNYEVLYKSELDYNYYSVIDDKQRKEFPVDIDYHIKHQHIKMLDGMVYGQYRNYLKEQVFKFLREMDKYKKTYTGYSGQAEHVEYVIPDSDIIEFRTSMLQLISEIE